MIWPVMNASSVKMTFFICRWKEGVEAMNDSRIKHKSVAVKDVLILGFAFFATYFGAGNLIFPPQLGFVSGSSYGPALVGLTLSGILLPIFALLIISRYGDVRRITERVGPYTYNILLTLLMIVCIFVSIPRTCATAIQLGIQGNFPNVPFIPGVVIYFLLSYWITSDETSVLDKVGKFLTPLLALILVVIGVLGVVSPIGIPAEPTVANSFTNAFLGGYNTGDVLVSFIMASLFIQSVENKGYVESRERNRMMFYCGAVSVILLFIIYGSLLFMGACVSADVPSDTGRAELLVLVIKRVGGVVMLPMGVAVILACLTTAVGQIAAVADFFHTASSNHVSYKVVAIMTCILSALTALLGVDGIVEYIGWIFGVSYPPVLALMVLGTFASFISHNEAYKGATYAVTAYALIEALPGLSSLEVAKSIVSVMPLSAVGFGWVTPFVVGLIVGSVVGHMRRQNV